MYKNQLREVEKTVVRGRNPGWRNEKIGLPITYSDVEPEETESFLSKVYGGSVGMMVSNLVGRGALSEQEIQELKAILDAAEKQEESSC